MKVIVVGFGKIGKQIVESLIKEKHDVTVIEENVDVANQIKTQFDAMSVAGNGTSYESLQEAGISSCDLFISVTGSDEVNLLSAFIAKTLGAKHTVARVRDSEYNSENFDYIKEQLRLTYTINPELLTAQTLFNIIKLPSATMVETFTTRAFEIAELTVPETSLLNGISLIEARKKVSYEFLICSVLRDGTTIIPNGNFVIKAGDKVGILSQNITTHKLLKSLGLAEKALRSVTLIGASKIAYYLSKLLLASKTPVKIIEKDENRAMEISALLNGEVPVILGDALSKDNLLESGIKNTDAVVTLTGQDEQNVILSAVAKNYGVKKVITKISRQGLLEVADSLEVECPVSPKKLVADILVRYARAIESSTENKIESVYSLFGGAVQAVEFEILPSFNLVNIPIKNLSFEDNTLIVGILRGKNAIIPGGNDVINVGDKIIIVTAQQNLIDLNEVIKEK